MGLLYVLNRLYPPFSESNAPTINRAVNMTKVSNVLPFKNNSAITIIPKNTALQQRGAGKPMSRVGANSSGGGILKQDVTVKPWGPRIGTSVDVAPVTMGGNKNISSQQPMVQARPYFHRTSANNSTGNINKIWGSCHGDWRVPSSGSNISQASNKQSILLVSCLAYLSNLKMEATHSSKLDIDFQQTTGHNIIQDCTLNSCNHWIWIFLYFVASFIQWSYLFFPQNFYIHMYLHLRRLIFKVINSLLIK